MCEHSIMKREKKLIDLNLAKKIIKECSILGVKRIVLSRLGEPLLHPNLKEIIKFTKSNKIRNVSMVCNAMLLNDEKCKELIESGLDLISFSVDAAKKDKINIIAVRIYNSDDYDNVKGWLKKDLKNKAILFHSTSYPYGYKLFREFPVQTSFDDINPIFI